MAIAYSVRVSGGGTDSFHGFEYFGLITLASLEFRVLIAVFPASLRCLRIFGFVSVAWCCDPTFFCLPSRFTIVRYLYWFLGLCGVSPVFSVVIARTIPAPVLVLALRSVAMWRLFPQFRGFCASFGDFCSCLRNFSASASIPWLRLWCGLFCSACLFSAFLYPAVAGLVVFSFGLPSLVVPVCVWGSF